MLGLNPAMARTGCSGDEPLVVGYGENAPSNVALVAPSFFGEWRLPISAEDPDVMTYARVRVDILSGPDGHGAFLLMKFSFPDPQPWGLPFSFERVEFSWESQGRPHSVQMDWSEDCTGPGRSMFPGDEWSELLELSSDSGNLVFERPVFRVWGSRN
ncbi:MAG: hypothetical protein ACJ763_03750 [Bdellovibrionia bacterium]